MQIKNLLPLAMGAAVSAQSLAEALAANNATLSSLTTLLGTNPALLETLGGLSDITVLAPSNQALAAFLNSTAAANASPEDVAALLQYHVLNGTIRSTDITNMTAFVPTLLTMEPYINITTGQVVGAQTNGSNVNIYSGLLGEATVTTADLNFTGGVIHIIDELLTLPVSPSDTALAAGLTALYGALNATGLVEAVDSAQDVTIFAPSNAAFSQIANLVSNLTTEAAASILQYHVVVGQVIYSPDITMNTTLTTLQGGEIDVTVIDGEVFINSAKVVTPNVLVSNGVVHVIDGVLNPDNSDATPNPTTTTAAFPGASTVEGGVPYTSGVTAPTTVMAPTNTGAPGSGPGVSTSSQAAGAARALQTGAVGLGALFGGAMVLAL